MGCTTSTKNWKDYYDEVVADVSSANYAFSESWSSEQKRDVHELWSSLHYRGIRRASDFPDVLIEEDEKSLGECFPEKQNLEFNIVEHTKMKLEAHRGSPDFQSMVDSFTLTSDFGVSQPVPLLIEAILKDKLWAVELLLEMGANVNIATPENLEHVKTFYKMIETTEMHSSFKCKKWENRNRLEPGNGTAYYCCPYFTYDEWTVYESYPSEEIERVEKTVVHASGLTPLLFAAKRIRELVEKREAGNYAADTEMFIRMDMCSALLACEGVDLTCKDSEGSCAVEILADLVERVSALNATTHSHKNNLWEVPMRRIVAQVAVRQTGEEGSKDTWIRAVERVYPKQNSSYGTS